MGIFDRFRKSRDRPDPYAARYPNSTSPEAGARSARSNAGSPKPPPEAPRQRVTKIEREVMALVFESARSTHPTEFSAVLRAEKDTVTELLIVPAVSGNRHAIMHLTQLPIDPSAVGTVHSHPTPNAIPSDADKQLFRHFGHTHIIVGYPYNMRTWRAYNHDAQVIALQVV